MTRWEGRVLPRVTVTDFLTRGFSYANLHGRAVIGRMRGLKMVVNALRHFTVTSWNISLGTPKTTQGRPSRLVMHLRGCVEFAAVDEKGPYDMPA